MDLVTGEISTEVPSGEELRARIDAIRPLLERNAEQAEAERRVPQENLDALTEAGAFRVAIPRRFGGYQLTIREQLDVSSAVAEGCGSTAWVVALTNVCNWATGTLCDRTQTEVWGQNPDARVVGVLAPTSDVKKVDGGYRVSGKWPFTSGCLHADWVLNGVVIPDESGQVVDQGAAMLPMSDLTIEDTWFVAGMKGSGSNTIVADDVFVPEHRVHSVSRVLAHEYPTEHKDEALYRSAFVPVMSLVLAGAQLGLGRAALRLVMEKAPRRGITYTNFERQTDSAGFQIQIAQASMLIDTAHLHAFRAAADIDNAAFSGETLGYEVRARVRLDTAYAIARVREAIDLLLSAHGAASFALVSPLQRIWRDSNTAGRHAFVDLAVNQELYGKAILGVSPEENITPLV
jgi:alkylation response protein AidB-like acyl-CoA dehydrogenase